MSSESHYSALLVRWQEEDHQRTHWRATVVNAYTGEEIHFISKQDLLRFLWQSINREEKSHPKQGR